MPQLQPSEKLLRLLPPDFLAGVKAGVAAAKEGKITPWEDVERELWPDEDPGK